MLIFLINTAFDLINSTLGQLQSIYLWGTEFVHNMTKIHYATKYEVVETQVNLVQALAHCQERNIFFKTVAAKLTAVGGTPPSTYKVMVESWSPLLTPLSVADGLPDGTPEGCSDG